MSFPKIILFDLDETIHFSEEMKAKAWTDILRPFGYCWEEENIDNLISVPKDKRPKSLGLSPNDFIATLVHNLGLSNMNVNLYGENLTPDEIKYRKNLSQLLSDGEKFEKMIKIMKSFWSSSLIDEAKRFVKEGRIKEVPGAVGAIMAAYKKGYKIGVVTQAPAEYAEIVLGSLGLLNTTLEDNFIDVIISGDMVQNKKPHPESLILATELIIIKTTIKEKEVELKKELTFKEKIGLGRSIHQEYFGPDKIVYPSPVAVVGDSEADIKAGHSYPGTDIKKILINSRNLSSDEIQRIKPKPDFTINHFRRLLSKIERNIHHVEKRH